MKRPTTPLTAPRLLVTVAISAVVAVGCGLVALAYGSSGFGGFEVIRGVLTGSLDAAQEAIVMQARLPRVVFAAIVGAALATSGAVFQTVLRNPLADPYILGISGGAALGGTIFMTLGSVAVATVTMGVPAAAFVGALGALALIFAVERWTPASRASNYVLLLTGVVFNAFASAIIMFLKSVVSAQKAQELLFYLMGSLAVEGTDAATIVACAAVVLACVVGLIWFARDLNALSLGDDDAAALGVPVTQVRRWTVGISSVAVAVAVAFSGLIGFVGLVVPHGIRLVVGPDHRVLLPTCALGGAGFLIVADLVARSAFGVFSSTLPVGVVTAAIGAPLFVFFLWRSMN
ncbi:FecCD family ABC transporter permease [Persicimonas caeni]|uniref:FecCD family ABC transporter permease n=1 Tax=Persicimonas caeni TaxID=2292766 RepID=UPI001C9A536C|nr:iron ABC transporter permease [Persicimonas caeni]